MPQAIKSIEIIQGDGSAGSIKQINFAEGSPFKCVKYRVDELNEKTFTYGYTLIEGDSLAANLEKITYEVKFEQSADGGSISKVTSKYYTVGDFTLKEDEVKAVRAQASAQALSSETPHTVTHVSGIGSLENAPTFFSILFDVQTLLHANTSSALFLLPRALLICCFSACHPLILKAWPPMKTGTAALAASTISQPLVEGGREPTLKDDIVDGSSGGALVTGILARNGGRLWRNSNLKLSIIS
ncbi:Major strawberry allergen Fra a 1-B [Sesamum angolense]|uniref:Major strawberry allergen Fra a 1-B n=1 Tax=Sesamum angolense TaxID=2727404 RepID=A0AAE2BK38_9LAMI|nr:Major strawberry allergen Fra a 1-B [Sesamum angolense]